MLRIEISCLYKEHKKLLDFILMQNYLRMYLFSKHITFEHWRFMNLGKENPAVINDIQSEEVQATSCNPTQEILMENESLSNTSNKTKKKKKKGNRHLWLSRYIARLKNVKYNGFNWYWFDFQ